MNSRNITTAEAVAILANENAEHLPYRVINAAGRAAVAQFVNAAAAEPARHNLDAWYAEAEQAANDAGQGAAIIIEMRGMHSASRNPRTLALDDDHFEWTING